MVDKKKAKTDEEEIKDEEDKSGKEEPVGFQTTLLKYMYEPTRKQLMGLTNIPIGQVNHLAWMAVFDVAAGQLAEYLEFDRRKKKVMDEKYGEMMSKARQDYRGAYEKAKGNLAVFYDGKIERLEKTQSELRMACKIGDAVKIREMTAKVVADYEAKIRRQSDYLQKADERKQNTDKKDIIELLRGKIFRKHRLESEGAEPDDIESDVGEIKLEEAKEHLGLLKQVRDEYLNAEAEARDKYLKAEAEAKAEYARIGKEQDKKVPALVSLSELWSELYAWLRRSIDSMGIMGASQLANKEMETQEMAGEPRELMDYTR